MSEPTEDGLPPVEEPGISEPEPEAAIPDDTQPEPEVDTSEETGPVRSYLLGTAAFLLVVVSSVVVAGAVSLQGLIKQEEAARSAWGEVAEVMNIRLGLLEECFIRVSWIRRPPGVMQEYRRALEATDTAEGMTEEVEAARGLDGAVASLLPALRAEAAARFSGDEELAVLLGRVEGSERLRAIAGERYDREVHTYRLRLDHIPTRWIGWLFAFSDLPYYLNPDSPPAAAGTSY